MADRFANRQNIHDHYLMGRHANVFDAPAAFEKVVHAGGPALRLLHGDLDAECLLIDPTTGRVVGLIDWEDACLGDPA